MTNQELATEKQRAMFFALGHSLGYESEDVKTHAKKHFGVEHFNELTKENLKFLLDKLLEQVDKKGGEK